MKIRRLVSLMMALILAIALAVPASAAELTYDVPGGKLYFDAATGTITRSDDTITEADIPAEINGIPVTAIGSAAFAQRYDLTRVTIPDTVTTIGRSAFYGCRSLTGIVIPDSVTSIDQDAFRNCTGLTRATLGGGMRSVPRAMFYGCSSLTSIIIPENITSIQYDAFSGSGLTSVTIPSSVTTISNSAFSSCRSLRSAYIPDSVTSIGEYAFFNCKNLTDAYYSGSVEAWAQIEIDSGNSALTNATIHYYSTGSGSLPANVCSMIGVLEEYDAQSREIFLFDREHDIYHYPVTDSTDLSFLDQLDSMIGKPMLIELR